MDLEEDMGKRVMDGLKRGRGGKSRGRTDDANTAGNLEIEDQNIPKPDRKVIRSPSKSQTHTTHTLLG